MANPVLGIDIAKDTFQVTLLQEGQPRRSQFANDAKGFAQLGRWLTKHAGGSVHACLEATGRYGDDLALWLHDAQHPVSVVNPARIKRYAQSQLQRNQTDRLDADLIAHFCQTQQPALWTPPAPEIREWQAILRQLDALAEMRQQEINRRDAGVRSPAVLAALGQHITFIEQQIRELTQQLREHIERHPSLRQPAELVQTIPGIGEATAWQLVAKDLAHYADARAAVADAGLNPRIVSSGLFKGHTRLSKMGDAHLRKALYFPALVARAHNPLIKAFCDQLAAHGKSKMAQVGAAMRKLLCLAYGVVKSGQPFDVAYRHPNTKREKTAAEPLASLVGGG